MYPAVVLSFLTFAKPQGPDPNSFKTSTSDLRVQVDPITTVLFFAALADIIRGRSRGDHSHSRPGGHHSKQLQRSVFLTIHL
jgi:hypothetical protein